jgi:amino acid transporter
MIYYALLAVIAGVLHGAWEYLHLPLYTGYETLGSGWQLVAFATVGDIGYTFFITFALAFYRRRIDWLAHPCKNDYLLSAGLGCTVALFVEYKALFLHRWSYAAAMPIIPLLHVGLSPILQMMLLTPLAIWLTRVALYARRNVASVAGVQ